MKTEKNLEKKLDLTDVFIYSLHRIKKNLSILDAHKIAYLLKSLFEANGFDGFGDKYKFDKKIYGIPYDQSFDDGLDSVNSSGLISLGYTRGEKPQQNTVGLTKLGSLYGDRIGGEITKILGRSNTKMLNSYIKCISTIKKLT